MRTKSITLKDAEGKDHDYEITPFGGRQGLSLAREILPLFDGVVTVVSGETNIDITRALRSVASILDEDTVATLLSQTSRDGRKLTIAAVDEAYMANYSELLHALFEVLTLNFGSIITDAGKLKELVDS